MSMDVLINIVRPTLLVLASKDCFGVKNWVLKLRSELGKGLS